MRWSNVRSLLQQSSRPLGNVHISGEPAAEVVLSHCPNQAVNALISHAVVSPRMQAADVAPLPPQEITEVTSLSPTLIGLPAVSVFQAFLPKRTTPPVPSMAQNQRGYKSNGSPPLVYVGTADACALDLYEDVVITDFRNRKFFDLKVLWQLSAWQRCAVA